MAAPTSSQASEDIVHQTPLELHHVRVVEARRRPRTAQQPEELAILRIGQRHRIELLCGLQNGSTARSSWSGGEDDRESWFGRPSKAVSAWRAHSAEQIDELDRRWRARCPKVR